MTQELLREMPVRVCMHFVKLMFTRPSLGSSLARIKAKIDLESSKQSRMAQGELVDWRTTIRTQLSPTLKLLERLLGDKFTDPKVNVNRVDKLLPEGTRCLLWINRSNTPYHSYDATADLMEWYEVPTPEGPIYLRYCYFAELEEEPEADFLVYQYKHSEDCREPPSYLDLDEDTSSLTPERLTEERDNYFSRDDWMTRIHQFHGFLESAFTQLDQLPDWSEQMPKIIRKSDSLEQIQQMCGEVGLSREEVLRIIADKIY